MSHYENANSTIYFSSSQQMTEIQDESVALVVTSPPYFNYVEYGNIGIGTESSYQEYIQNLQAVFSECYRVLIPDGKVCINITNMKSRKGVEGKAFVYPIVADVTKFMQELGYIFWDEIIWVKADANHGALGGKPLFGSYPFPPNPKILDSIFENILIFKKDGKLPNRVSEKAKQDSRLSKEEWQKFTKGIWYITPNRNIDHPASFPVELPYRLIRLYSFIGETVLDPFAGSATSVAVAAAVGRKGVGFEIHEGYKEFIQSRFEQLNCLDLSLLSKQQNGKNGKSDIESAPSTSLPQKENIGVIDA